MLGRRSDSGDTGASVALPKAAHQEPNAGLADHSSSEAPNEREEGTRDTAWTVRLLGSLVAWGRRDRGLVRSAQSAGHDYAAYDAPATAPRVTARGRVDLGTVEVADTSRLCPPKEDHDKLRAERAAPTVKVAFRRRSRRWAVAACLAALGATWVAAKHRFASQSVSEPSGVATRAPAPASPRADPSLSPQLASVPSESSPPSAANVDRQTMPSAPKREPAASKHEPLKVAPSPSSSEAHGPAGRQFIDVMTRY